MPRERAYRTASATFAVSYMSNAKWIKAFTAIARLGQFVAEWKLIDQEVTHGWGNPWEDDLYPIGLLGGGYDAVEYRWIEWIRFPCVWRPYPGVGVTREQDVDSIAAALDAVGQFHLERGNDSLILYGYGR